MPAVGFELRGQLASLFRCGKTKHTGVRDHPFPAGSPQFVERLIGELANKIPDCNLCAGAAFIATGATSPNTSGASNIVKTRSKHLDVKRILTGQNRIDLLKKRRIELGADSNDSLIGMNFTEGSAANGIMPRISLPVGI